MDQQAGGINGQGLSFLQLYRARITRSLIPGGFGPRGL